MLRTVLLLLTVILLNGCASNESKRQQTLILNSQLQLHQMHLNHQIQNSNTPICKIECPETGCVMKSFECNVKTDIAMPEIKLPRSDAEIYMGALTSITNTALTTILPGYMAYAGWNAMGRMASDLSRNISGPITTNYDSFNTNSGVQGDGQIGSSDGNLSGSGVIGSGHQGSNDGNLLGTGVIGDGRFGGADGNFSGNNRESTSVNDSNNRRLDSHIGQYGDTDNSDSSDHSYYSYDADSSDHSDNSDNSYNPVTNPIVPVSIPQYIERW